MTIWEQVLAAVRKVTADVGTLRERVESLHAKVDAIAPDDHSPEPGSAPETLNESKEPGNAAG